MKKILVFTFAIFISSLFIYSCKQQQEDSIIKIEKTQNEISLRGDEWDSGDEDPCTISLPCYDVYTGAGCVIELQGESAMEVIMGILEYHNFDRDILAIRLVFASKDNEGIRFTQTANAHQSTLISIYQDDNQVNANAILIDCGAEHGFSLEVDTPEGELTYRCQPFVFSCPEECCD